MASASSVKTLNPKAEVMGPAAALFMNINAANGLASVLKSNLGPNGTIKMLVGGAGDVKLTKDGNVLLRDMQIQSPTAVMIARAASAVDDATGESRTRMRKPSRCGGNCGFRNNDTDCRCCCRNRSEFHCHGT